MVPAGEFCLLELLTRFASSIYGIMPVFRWYFGMAHVAKAFFLPVLLAF